MNNNGKIVQLLNPTNNQDAATKSYVDTKFKNVPTPTNTNDAANKGYVDTSIPIGGIIMWSGSNSSLPTNWKFCDGSTYGSITTPDLRGRFVMCMNRQLNGEYLNSGPLNYWAQINTTGGSPHAVVVSHSHGVTWSAGNPANIHKTGIRSWPAGAGHTDGTSLTINSEGVSGTNERIPQHYVLAYIMRVS